MYSKGPCMCWDGHVGPWASWLQEFSRLRSPTCQAEDIIARTPSGQYTAILVGSFSSSPEHDPVQISL